MGSFFKGNIAGSGVAKNSAQKKPFFRFWELFLNKFWTFFKINLVYTLFCLPIVTFGPATAAMTAMMRNIYLERPQFIFYDFKEQFKKNFKQSFFIGILDVAAIAGVICLFWSYSHLTEPTDSQATIFFVSIGVSVLFVLLNFYIYPQIVALDLTVGQILRNSVILMFVNPWREFIALAFVLGYAVLLLNFTLFVAVWIPFLPAAWLAFLAVFCCYPAIQKYLINPYYERTGEKNPELPDDEDDEALFEDRGGEEEPVEIIDLRRERKHSKGKKVIK